jgi:hypothetical protein
MARRIAAASGIPVYGRTESATSRWCAQPAQRPSRPERPSVATLVSREVAPQSGQTIDIGKRTRTIQGSEPMTSPLRIAEPSPFANAIPGVLRPSQQRGLRCPHGFVYGSTRVGLDRIGMRIAGAAHGPAGPKQYDRNA